MRTSKPTIVRALVGQVVVQVKQFASAPSSLLLLLSHHLMWPQVTVCIIYYDSNRLQVAVSVNHGVALSQEMRAGDSSACRCVTALPASIIFPATSA